LKLLKKPDIPFPLLRDSTENFIELIAKEYLGIQNYLINE